MSLFKPSKEKRKDPRIPFWAKVKVALKRSVSDEALHPDILGAENMSQSGILVETSYPYPVNAPCRVFIRENSFKNETVINGFVVRSEASRRGKFYDTGISFPSLSPDQKSILSKIISFYTT